MQTETVSETDTQLLLFKPIEKIDHSKHVRKFFRQHLIEVYGQIMLTGIKTPLQFSALDAIRDADLAIGKFLDSILGNFSNEVTN